MPVDVGISSLRRGRGSRRDGSFPSIGITVKRRGIERERERREKGSPRGQWIIRENMRSKRRRTLVVRLVGRWGGREGEGERIPFGGFFAWNFDPSGIPSGFHPWTKGLKIFARETRATPRLRWIRQRLCDDLRHATTGHNGSWRDKSKCKSINTRIISKHGATDVVVLDAAKSFKRRPRLRIWKQKIGLCHRVRVPSNCRLIRKW